MIYALFHQGEVAKAVTLMGAKPFVLTTLPDVTNKHRLNNSHMYRLY